MSIVLDGRPPGVVIGYRPGITMTLSLVSQVPGALAGRSFTSTLNGVPISVTINGDVMTVEATAAQTTTAGLGLKAWVLNETTSGTPEPVIAGYWEGSNDPAVTPGETSATIVEGDLVLELSVNVGGVSAAVLAAHAALETAHGWTVDANGNTRWDGAVLTDHDREWYWAEDMARDSSATYVGDGNQHVGFGGWDFSATVNQRIKFRLDPGDAWEAYTLRFGWISPGATTGEAIWRHYAHQLNLGGNPGTDPPLVATLGPVAHPTPGFGGGWRYDTIIEGAPITPIDLGAGPIQPLINMVIERNAVADSSANVARIIAVSVTRADV